MGLGPMLTMGLYNEEKNGFEMGLGVALKRKWSSTAHSGAESG